MEANFYPPVSFYFKVEFQGLPSGVSGADVNFQEVSGLSATVETQDIAEGGQNAYKHKLPTRTTYDKLTLKRGLITSSALLRWCYESITDFSFKPITVFIHLLDENGDSRMSWQVINAFPVKWSVSNFNAEQNAIAVESIELSYLYFTTEIPDNKTPIGQLLS
jgi:phage tail-like protein